jgi:multisubunit Na+/H+ antiporter MnhB subunit
MFQRTLSAPEIGLIAGTRLALGVGIGLLISGRLSDDQRRAAGWALAVVGGITTIPLIAHVIAGGRDRAKELLPAA